METDDDLAPREIHFHDRRIAGDLNNRAHRAAVVKMPKAPKRITIKQIDDAEVPVEVLAKAIVAIVAIADGVKRLRAGPINEKTLRLLIQHSAPGHINVATIGQVLDGLEQLEAACLRARSKR